MTSPMRHGRTTPSFPLDVFPPGVRDFIETAAENACVDHSFIGVPALGVLAAAIGNSAEVELRAGWREPSVLWCVIIGDPSTRKSPALDAAVAPMRRLESESRKLHEAELAALHREHDASEQAEPVARRFVVDDVTMEALVGVLADQPRGVLLSSEELSAWFGGFDAYRNGKGNDESRWLSLYGGRAITVDRKTGDRRSVHVPRPAVSIVGGSQPGVLRRILTPQHHASGLVARLFFAFPPKRPARWHEGREDLEAQRDYARAVRRLANVPLLAEPGGEPSKRLLTLDHAARAAWRTHYDQHQEEILGMPGDSAAAASKLDGGAARIALVLEYARWTESSADDDTAPPRSISEWAMAGGIRLARWFEVQAERVRELLGSDRDEECLEDLVQRVRVRGGEVTAREFRSTRRGTGGAESDLTRLVEAGFGSWTFRPSGPLGGKPARVFRLYPHPRENGAVTSTSAGGPGDGGIGYVPHSAAPFEAEARSEREAIQAEGWPDHDGRNAAGARPIGGL